MNDNRPAMSGRCIIIATVLGLVLWTLIFVVFGSAAIAAKP